MAVVLHKNIMPLDASLSLLVEVTSGITSGCSCAKLLVKSRSVYPNADISFFIYEYPKMQLASVKMIWTWTFWIIQTILEHHSQIQKSIIIFTGLMREYIIKYSAVRPLRAYSIHNIPKCKVSPCMRRSFAFIKSRKEPGIFCNASNASLKLIPLVLFKNVSNKVSHKQDVCDGHSSLFAIETSLISSFNDRPWKQQFFKWKMVQYDTSFGYKS